MVRYSLLRQMGLQVAVQAIRAISQQRIVSGPFSGTRFVWPGLQYIPCLLGTYELELREALEKILAWRPEDVIDIGAASGVYVVGLAVKLPKARVVAFEADACVRQSLMRNVVANTCANRVCIDGYCDVGRLRAAIEPSRRTLVICDVEGFEHELLDAENIPELRRTMMLVETHEHVVPNCIESLIERFTSSHEIRRYVARPRLPSDFPWQVVTRMGTLSRRIAVRMMDELRPRRQEWLLCVPRDPDRTDAVLN